MKILFFIQNLGIGGVERQLSILTDHLVRRGHDVSIVALYTVDQDWELLWKIDSVEVKSLLSRQPKGTLSAGIELIKASLHLRGFIKKENIQIVYGYEGHIGRFIAWLTTRCMANTKLVWGIQGWGQRDPLRRYDWKLTLPFYLCKWVSASVPVMISNSEAGYNYRKAKGYRCMKQLVINNGFDVERFKPSLEARAQVRHEWKINNERLIGIVARLFISKGHPTFLEAAALLANERKDLRFVIIGDGSGTYKRQLEQLSERLGLTEHLIWAGVREDMPAVYNALDILCSSSYTEGFSNVLGEAMACGVPCVVTDVGDSAKIVGDQGIIVPPGNPQKLAEGLKTMLLELHDIKPHLLRERIVTRFAVETMVESTEKALIEA